VEAAFKNPPGVTARNGGFCEGLTLIERPAVLME
jgi:hypothetical protein